GFRKARPAGRSVYRLFVRHRRKTEGLRADARQLFGAMHRPHFSLSILAGRALSQYSADKSRHRFHGRLHRTVRLRRHSSAPADTTARIYPRGIHEISDYLHESGAGSSEEPGTRVATALRRATARAPKNAECSRSSEPLAYSPQT